MTRLQVIVDEAESVRATLDDGSESAIERFSISPVRQGMLDLFGDWLASGWHDGARKITRRRELEVLGMLLYQALLPASLSGFFEEAVARSGADRDNRLRIELRFQRDDGLAQLPWEFLYRPDTAVKRGYFLAMEPTLVLSRFLPLQVKIAPLAPDDPPLRVLATAAKPSDLGTVREAPTLEAIAQLPARLPATVELLEQPTFARLIETIVEVRPHVVHLIAHGRYDANAGGGLLALVDDDNKAAWIPDSQLADAFGQAGVTPRVVVLHACEGATVDFGASFAGLAPKLIRAEVQAVVAMQYPVTNLAAQAFMTSFYDEVAQGRPLDAAVQAARWRITLTLPDSWNTGEFGVPVLYMRSSNAVVARDG